MARINLLPWREAARAQRIKEFGLMAMAFVILTIIAMLYWHWHNVGLMNYQKQRNAFLQEEIVKVEEQILAIERLEKTRMQLVSRMKIIQDLQASRPQIVHLIDELVVSVPQGVYLHQLQQKGNGVALKGRAQSNARVSAYMRNIEDSLWMASPSLKLIEKEKGESARDSDFELDFKQEVPVEEKES